MEVPNKYGTLANELTNIFCLFFSKYTHTHTCPTDSKDVDKICSQKFFAWNHNYFKHSPFFEKKMNFEKKNKTS